MSLDIFQSQIDRLSAALMAGDFETYQALMDDPLVMISDRGTKIIEDEADLRFGFDSYAQMLRVERASDLVRLAYSVTELGADLLTGRFETHILSSGQRIYGPFQSSLSMRRIGTRWKISSIVTSTHGELWPYNRPKIVEDGRGGPGSDAGRARDKMRP